MAKICSAKRIDTSLLMDTKLNALVNDLTNMKNVGPKALAKAQAKLDIFTKKRLAAIQVVSDTIENKAMISELLGQPHRANMPNRKSLLYQQNIGVERHSSTQNRTSQNYLGEAPHS